LCDLQVVWNLVEAKFRHLVLEKTYQYRMIRYKWPPLRVSSWHLDMDLLQNFRATRLLCTSSVRCNSATTKVTWLMNLRYFIIEPLILEFNIWYIVCLKGFTLSNVNKSKTNDMCDFRSSYHWSQMVFFMTRRLW
jgi:hypothetical protein